MLTKTDKDVHQIVEVRSSHSTVQVRVLNAALEERANGDVILRGSIHPDFLRNLKTDDYQREVLSANGGGKKSRLRRGIEDGVTLPDIELGMRGSNVSFKGTTAILHDPVYIIDGLQRVSTLIQYMDENGREGVSSTNPLGATVHFNTTKDWENKRFTDLNTLRTPVSPNVMLRNQRAVHPSVLTLYGLTHNDQSFCMYRRVCWQQRMLKSELLSATSMMRAALALHRSVTERTSATQSKKAIGRGEGAIQRALDMMDRTAKDIGLSNFRENVKEFFEIIDSCWGIRNVEYAQSQAHLRGNFLVTLGTLFSRNPQLWRDGKRIFMDSKTRQRLATFPINDPEIRRLCSAGTMVLPTLYNYLLEHMNKGKSKHRLV